MNVSVLVPFKPDAGERDRIWAWMRQRWEQTLPDYQLIVCSDGSAPGEPFNEGKAWNECARQASGDLFVVAESEVGFDHHEIRSAVGDVEWNGGWRIAERYLQIKQVRSEYVLNAFKPSAEIAFSAHAIERAFVSESVSPLLVVPREAWDLVGGMDERYVGWGHIDKAFAAAMSTLYEPFERFAGAVWHLHHSRSEHRDCNSELTARYLAAAGDPDAMRAIIAERAAAPC